MLQTLKSRTLIKGTLILTATGLATRVLGFFFRVFLSHTFGEEGVGLYQLIFPIYSLCISLSCAGLQIALTRCVAKNYAQNNHQKAINNLYTALFLSVFLSVIILLFIQKHSFQIAQNILHEKRCALNLTIISFAFPFSAVHSCIVGFFLGVKNTKIPAVSQLLEQIVRISSVFILFQIGLSQNIRFGISIAVAGLVIGEIASSAYCIYHIRFMHNPRPSISNIFQDAISLITLSAPLTASRVLLNILQSVESISIPLKLQFYGYSSHSALSIYGVLTGMALPCILFPSSLTNSISTMLLPAIAEIQAKKNKKSLKIIMKKSIFSCMALGFGCLLFFLVIGKPLGNYVFHSQLAGSMITVLSFICPFLYTNTTLISILNGMGKTTITFLINAFSISIRIISVLYIVPFYGIYGYLIGLLFSQLFIFFLSLSTLNYILKKGI